MNRKIIIKVVVVGVVAVAMFLGLLFASWVENYYREPIEINSDGNIVSAKSYNEIYRVLTSSSIENGLSLWDRLFGNNDYSDIGSEDEIDDNSQDFYETDYSVTNVQTPGVDEGDIVKTDGNYLYVSDESSSVNIYDMKSAVEILIANISLDDIYGEISDMYVNGERLIIICDDYEYYGETIIYTYDLSTISYPTLVSEIHQSGSYVDSRLVGNILYTFSDYILYDFSRQDCVPYIDGEKIKAEDVYYVGEINKPEFSVITSLDISSPEDFIDNKAVLGSAGDIYISNENVYFAALNSESGTDIIKFSYNEGNIKGEAFGNVDGAIKDSFAMDEFQGNLRVATSSIDNGNAIYVLDKSLKEIGSVEGITIGESIYSSRYLGDIAYFVTYEKKDPLIAVDLSNPASPKVLSELTVTGFSEYLHFWNKNLLIGIGEETNPDTGESLGVKISMYDISDPANIKVENELVMDKYGFTSAESNHKAVLIDPEKNIIGIPVESDYESDGYYVDYLVLSYNEETGFETKIIDNIYNEETGNGEYSYLGYDLTDGTRGLYIGDKLFVVSHNYRISKYDLNTYQNLEVYDIFDENMSLPEV